MASLVPVVTLLTQDEFFELLRTSPQFSALANKQVKQATVMGLSTGAGVTAGMLVAGPVGAAVGGIIGYWASTRAVGAKRSDLTLLQLIAGLNDEQRAELWAQVSVKFGHSLTAASLLQQSQPVLLFLTSYLTGGALQSPSAASSASGCGAPGGKNIR